MTVAVASHQRREPLLRLLRELDAQAAAAPELGRDLDVLVVLDGSTDGSKEAVEAESWALPVRVHWQPNRGLASARNVGLEAAGDGLVWFLDDDLVPTPGLLERHRTAHEVGPPGVVVGPCRIPPDADAPAPLLDWWDEFYAELERAGRIDRFDRFTVANASAPAAVIRAAGGFDESFVTYGLEDYELGVRLLAAGTPLRFDAAAVAWHPDIPPLSLLITRQRELGRNAARLAALHPETVDLLFPPGRTPRPRRLLRRLRLRSPVALHAVSRAALAGWRVSRPVHRGLARRFEHLARAAAHAAGVAAGDPSGALLARLLGHDPAPTPAGGVAAPRRRSSTQPAASPRSSDHTISR
jgi:glycosyltransferase involved in cell wall biosynthesis